MSQITDFAYKYSRVQDLLPAEKKRIIFLLARQTVELEPFLAIKQEIDDLITQTVQNGWDSKEIKHRLTSLSKLVEKTSKLHLE